MSRIAPSFLRLDDLLLPPPLPSILSILIVLGVVFLGIRLARFLRGGKTETIDLAAGFVLATGILTGAIHITALLKASPLIVLRTLGAVLAAFGVFQVYLIWRSRKQLVATVISFYGQLPTIARVGLILGALIVAALSLAALGPATDIDSLDYHLGVPLEWIRQGGAVPRPDWFHARLIGIGEMINLLGLAAGTDGLGAAFQASGLLVAIVAVSAFASMARDQILATLLVAACPLMVGLVPSQKPQLLPAAAASLALVIIVRRFRDIDGTSLLLAFGCAAFALACKYSFLFSATIAFALGMFAAYRSRRLQKAWIIAAGTLAALVLPVLLRNLAFYGDPISPFLERWKPVPDPAILGFAWYLRNFAGLHALAKLMRLPWDLSFTIHSGELTAVLGIGVLAVLVISLKRPEAKLLLAAALAAAILITALGQLSARFYLEPYLWCAAAAVASSQHLIRRFLFGTLIIQGVLTLALSLYAACTLFPGALTSNLRERCLTLAAEGYDACKWMDRVLPDDAVILAEIRSTALLPRPSVSWDLARFQPYGLPSQSAQAARIISQLRERQANALIVRWPVTDGFLAPIAPYLGARIAEPTTFCSTGRNPLIRGPLYDLVAIRPKIEILDSTRKKP